MLLNRRLRQIKKAVAAWSKKPAWQQREITNILEQDFGCEYLGGGCYAHVYALDENTVLKIIKNVDSGYERFVRRARRSRSTWLPRIYYSGTWGKSRVFILERLEQDDDRGEELSQAINFITEYGSNNRWLACQDEGLAGIIKYLAEDNCINDIHCGNIMFRGNQPVLTDPCT